MIGWQDVDTDKLNQPRARTIRGVDVTVYFGQDDMPTGIKGGYDHDRRQFVIKFRYDENAEPTKRISYGDHAMLLVGKNSERLLEVELDVDAIGAQAVRLLPRVESVLDDLAKGAPKGLDRQDNYIAASGAFKQVRPRLQFAITP